MIPGLGGLPGGMPGMPGLGGGLPSMPGLGGGLPNLPGLPSMPNLPGMQGAGLRPPGLGPANLQATLAALQSGLGMPGLPKPGMPGMPGMRPPNLPGLMRPPLLGGGTGPNLGGTSKAGPLATPQGLMAKASGPTPLAPGPLAQPATSLQAPAPCTVYVGRISSEVSDDFIRQLLEKCGTVLKWNRAADPNTSKLTSFGFCDFEAPQGVWRALEYLHEKQLCDKRLLVKCEEKAKQTIDQWKDARKLEFEKTRKDEAEKASPKAGVAAFAKAIEAAKSAKVPGLQDTDTAKDGSEKDGEKSKVEEGPLDDTTLQAKLCEESKDVAATIGKLLQDKNKGYPELSAEADNKEESKEEENASKELEKREKGEDKENDKENASENKKVENEEKSKESDRKSEERGKKRTRSEERKLEKEKEKEREKRAAVSRHYRPSRRERDRDQRIRDRDRDIEKEYQYRIREFERNEEHRIKNLKRDLRELETTEPSERETRKFQDADLHFGKRESEERDWKRYREDRARERQKEKEKDNADRAQVQREIDEERRKKEKEEEEERRRKEKEAEAERLKREKEAEDKRRKEEDEERQRKQEIEDARRKKREEEEAEKRRIAEEERRVKEAEERKVQQAAANKLLVAIQEEMRLATPEKLTIKAPVVTGTVDGPRGFDSDEKQFKHKPLVRAPDEARAPPPSTTPASAATEAKLKDEEMRKLIQQVPTDKAKAFAFDIDWSIVHQNGIIEKKLRPWVRKKVTEYLGAEEQGMIEFIMRKVSSHTPPATILAELEGFIDEEAENFTLKMWRMLIFEVLRCKAR